MIRGGDFYAVWLENEKRWSTEKDDVISLIDSELYKYYEEHKDNFEVPVKVLYLRDSENGMIDRWNKYCKQQMFDTFHMLDEKLIFSNTEVTKKDYSSKRLPYPLEDGDTSAYDRLMSTLYSEEERKKIEWCIGSIVTGDSKKLQKFMVLYGAAGTGKSTVLNIIQQLFDGYYSVFDAKSLTTSSNSFALEAFKSNPLVAIQHDGDLSHIEDNTRLNSLVSHEMMEVNEKFKSTYQNRFKAFLFMGTNNPVKITDAKSGLIRRLIDVTPSGNKLSAREYKSVTKQIGFELGAIAWHCKEVYESDPGMYDNYIPSAMLEATNDLYNFVADSYLTFKHSDGVALDNAWRMYKEYCSDSNVAYPLSKRVFREQLRDYFLEYRERVYLPDGSRPRSYYSGFLVGKFRKDEVSKEPEENNRSIEFLDQVSIFDTECCNFPAQYATDNGVPLRSWDKVTTSLADIDTSKLHYVRVPENHIVIDFDIPGDDGEKSFERNLEEASKWPPTYAELSKSGKGIHLHYIYDGDVSRLSRVYADHIEIKVFNGNSSLRRKLTLCNALQIAKISSGLPLQEEKKKTDGAKIKSQKKLLEMMNAADEKDRENSSMGMMGGGNPFADSLPPELRAMRQNNRPSENSGIPDFLTRSNNKVEERPSSNIPDFETFKKQIEKDNSPFNPFESTPKVSTEVVKPAKVEEDDDLGFDVDELVKKIDAKIAELEAEEKKAKEEEEKKAETVKKEVTAIPELAVNNTSNSINDIYKETKEVVTKPVSTTTTTTTTTKTTNLSLDDDGDDDDFFDDFFDN